MRQSKYFLILIFVLSVFSFATPSYSKGGMMGEFGSFETVSGPLLLYPATDDINMRGNDSLEFRWKRFDELATDHYEFRLYKGYKTIESALIFKQDFPSGTYPIKIPASQFEEGEVYTWSLTQVFLGGRKSDASFSAFKILNK